MGVLFGSAEYTPCAPRRIGMRVSAELKRTLIQIAKNEGRSLVQVGTLFIAGAIGYMGSRLAAELMRRGHSGTGQSERGGPDSDGREAMGYG